MIIVPLVLPVVRRQLFALILQDLAGTDDMVNEVTFDGDDRAVFTRYSLRVALRMSP
ncbi:hypothetical protein REMIM1_PE00481 (plasmid) [Rhizobium etli bv. mimosae str. Mim1]|nr:hypothetical protein REMIM1_PE00481 [Rhizobium etli bv. mimosae str. Mim1]